MPLTRAVAVPLELRDCNSLFGTASMQKVATHSLAFASTAKDTLQ